jgi:hypothetical protein
MMVRKAMKFVCPTKTQSRLTYDEAVCEYEKRRETRLGRLLVNRELPILRKAWEIMNR